VNCSAGIVRNGLSSTARSAAVPTSRVPLASSERPPGGVGGVEAEHLAASHRIVCSHLDRTADRATRDEIFDRAPRVVFANEPSAAGAQQNDMSNKIFLAIVTAIMLAVLLPLLAQKFHECMEKGGSACPCKMGCPPVRAAHAPES
jgi:hypothetical protein